MSIPSKCTVLVVGGGPGGSYAASALAREGIDTVILEADVFPRYHVGESMISAMRHFLRFIDLDNTFNNYGFIKKTGAGFKLNKQKDAYTDFIVNAGPDAYAWNLIRSESDDLMFKHAAKCGAKIFDGVKVNTIEFTPLDDNDSSMDTEVTNPGRPISATWSRKDGSSGEIKFDYLVDASGRAGIVSTKYLKNRSFNQDLKNVASWGYWRGAINYGIGTPKEGQPFFEALGDGSGWTWFIPLHDGTTSVGVVMNQSISTTKKKAKASISSRDFYIESVHEAYGISHLLANAELATEIKHASDWSYSASSYASPFLRIVGDAGAFIDPYFSSGVHLALSGGLSAALTISASIRGDCKEQEAWKWHSKHVAERFTRFLLVVLSATKQIRNQDVPVLNEEDEDGFDRAFSIIRPVIQGTADVDGKSTQAEISNTVDFTYNAIQRSTGESEGVSEKMDGMNINMNSMYGKVPSPSDIKRKGWAQVNKTGLSSEEKQILRLAKNVVNDYFNADGYDGLMANLKRGNLGLVKVMPAAQIAVEG